MPASVWPWPEPALGAAAAAAHLVPSVVSLGTWTRLRALPGGWCRWRGPDVPAVALTFDDGPDPVTTPVVLDRLDELGLRATFFCLGERADAHPELVGEVLRRGHQIGSHGYRHEHHLARTPRWVDADLDAGLAAVGRASRGPAAVVPAALRPEQRGDAGRRQAPRRRAGAVVGVGAGVGGRVGQRRRRQRRPGARPAARSCCSTTAT